MQNRAAEDRLLCGILTQDTSTMASGKNRLAGETSPYLLQHADNPVDWYPWSPDALAKARSEGKPILLSIGYSACHWCHVMAHESFEDTVTAATMNEHFVNIKVDREERPDLDRVYQTAHQLLTRQTGGWPLTMFLDPNTLLPFFGGTYFPKTPRYQLPGFVDLLMRVAQAYRDQRDELAAQGTKLANVLASLNPTTAPGELKDAALLTAARDQLASQYDARNGGFGDAPKFPMPATIERLLRHWAFIGRDGQKDRETLEMAMITLTRIARGGIYDHLGGGFCRYSTDARWIIPHFEKMLYDNGALLGVYADALAIGPDPLFEQIVRETAAWMMREMQHEDGGYFSAIDADSEGEEGKYYVWRRDEVKRLLTEDEYLVVETLYGLDNPANFEGKWNLYRDDAWHSVVERLAMPRADADALLASARHKLFEARSRRVAPDKDDKILTAWNGLAIRGMARAGLVLGEPKWVESATRAADFIRKRCVIDDRLCATWRDGRARHQAYLDDYANLLDGLLTLLQARWRDSDLRFAKSLADTVIARFYDDDGGGFFFTARDSEALIHRPKPTVDDAMPPGNGVLARALNLLGHLLGETRYLDAASGTLKWARKAMEQYPAGHSTLLGALEDQLTPPELVIVRGPRTEIDAWLRPVRTGYRPWRHVFGIPYEDVGLLPGFLPRLVSAEKQRSCTAYVCKGLQCSLPIHSQEDLAAALKAP
jgi:uncharacterized protein YyaL (SSP411 family)